ncbi:hypothetical protein [Bacillus sp. mrc49]|uniref:hypothetical protein n=1 Tax=Bacillus sp. mrc49 TaxID=2054913 RepID=UPI001E2919F5|nr:hypothetical protein [Bacillus sp. mrc49]
MQKERLSYILPGKERKNHGRLEEMEYLNLPDRMFFHWCQQQYALNRGVYNTIDNWFHAYGIIDILYRRINLLAFLEYASDSEQTIGRAKPIKFGKGGLTKKLQDFMEM